MCNSQPSPNSIFPFHFPLKSFGIFQKTMNLHCNLLSSEDWNLRGGFHETMCSKLGQFSQIKVIIFVKTSNIYLRAGEWDLKQSREVASRYSDLGVHYKKYVEVAVPSK